MSELKGGCLCQAVRFTARGEIDRSVGICHCKMCQRWTGGPQTGVMVPEAAIEWEGLDHVARYRSSRWAERAWCGRCGSSLWFRVVDEGDPSGDRPGAYELPLGLFDDTGDFRLTREIFIDMKPGAYAFAGTHDRLTEADMLAEARQTGDDHDQV